MTGTSVNAKGLGMDWKEREAKRAELEYKRVPWASESWWVSALRDTANNAYYHYAHVSKDDPRMIAFTESDAKGEKDVQTRMKPGRYLRRFFGDVLDAKDIQRLAGQFAGENETHELKFASDPDDIIAAYANGPRSCMSGEESVRVYGAGDLAIAYLGDLDEDVTARVLCWPAKLVYGRPYGDAARLEAALEQAGYARDTGGDFNGAKLIREDVGDGYVGPYLDEKYRVSVYGDFLEMHREGEIDGASDTGLWGGKKCATCGSGVGECDGFYAEYEGPFCESCYYELFACCEVCDGTVSTDEVVGLPEDAHKYAVCACESCANELAPACAKCGDRGASDSMVHVEDINENWCQSCFANYGHVCVHCEWPAEHNGSEQVGDEYWCEICVRDGATQCARPGCTAYVADEDVVESRLAKYCSEECREDAPVRPNYGAPGQAFRDLPEQVKRWWNWHIANEFNPWLGFQHDNGWPKERPNSVEWSPRASAH